MYETPGRWRLDRRGPQHAAGFDSPAPLRRHGGRALRLIVAAGAWGAGLCLVVGMVAMVAQASVPNQRAHLGDRARLSSQPTIKGTAFDGYIKRFTGPGGPSVRYFQVAGHSRWELRWSYRCAGAAHGYLTISEPAISAGISVRATGLAAHGVTWAFSDATMHVLLIHGNCPWTVTVAGRR